MALPVANFGQSYSSGYSPDTLSRRLGQPQQPNQFSDPAMPAEKPISGARPVTPVAPTPPTYAPPPYMPPLHAAGYNGVSASPTGQIVQNVSRPPINPTNPVPGGPIQLPPGSQELPPGHPGHIHVNPNNVPGPNDHNGQHNGGQNNGGNGGGHHNGGDGGGDNNNNDGPQLTDRQLAFLENDPQYQDILLQLKGAKGDYKSQYNKSTEQIMDDFIRNRADTRRQENEATSSFNDAYAGSGMLHSSGMATDLGNLQGDFTQQLQDLISGKKTGLTSALTEKQNYMRQSELALLQARQDALRRFAAERLGTAY